MNNSPNNQNQKIEGVFGSEKEADNFINKINKPYNELHPTNNVSYSKRQAMEDKKTVNGNIEKGNWIINFEGEKEHIDDITTKITENGGFYL